MCFVVGGAMEKAGANSAIGTRGKTFFHGIKHIHGLPMDERRASGLVRRNHERKNMSIIADSTV